MKRIWIFRGVLAVVVIGALIRMYLNQSEMTMTHLTGQTMGTINYNVKYLGLEVPSYQTEVDSILIAFNQSLSTYIQDSEISKLNQTGRLQNPSKMMLDVLYRSRDVYASTDGAFDPTVGPLVNAWGFGPDKQPVLLDSNTVDSLRQWVGFNRVVFTEESVGMDSGMYLDFSAIAKGYAVDLVANFLEDRNIQDYLVEIGGEVKAHGKNDKGAEWSIGIEDPLVSREERRLMAVVTLTNRAMATSGNYRNYYEMDGKIIAHTIDPRSGYNTSHGLLSASVFAEDCMTADAYATAFMVLGPELSKLVISNAPIEAFLIIQESSGELTTFASEGIADKLRLNE